MQQDPLQHKHQLREMLKSHLKEMSPDAIQHQSELIIEHLKRIYTPETPSTIMLYMPMPSEVNVMDLLKLWVETGQRVCVPVVDWDTRKMVAKQIQSIDQPMKKLKFGLQEPESGVVVDPAEIDFIVVPGLGFDDKGARLGRGGGFYDRFLSKLPDEAIRCGVCFDCQMVEQIPVEAHDIRMNLVVTDQHVYQVD